MARYHDAFDDHDTPDLPIDMGGAVVASSLETIARDGARRMLARFLEEEVEEFLGRPRYAPAGGGTGYRNGYAAEREIAIGTLSVPVRAPRVSDLPEGSEPFRSAILPRGRYLAEVTRSLFARLYLEGLSSGDFEPAMRSLMGERATLSAPRPSCGCATSGPPSTPPGGPDRSRTAMPTSGATASTCPRAPMRRPPACWS